MTTPYIRAATLALVALAPTLAGPLAAQEAADESTTEQASLGSDGQGGTGALVDAEGGQLGNVSVSAAPSGVALVLVNAEGFGEGTYGMHLHQVGACDGPDFESAGPHIGEGEHGVLNAAGPHEGDLPNGVAGPDGQLSLEAFAVGLALDQVFDADGSALIVHAAPDDYVTQPGGGSGARIACAVIEAAPGTMADETVDSGEAEPVEESQATDEAQQEDAEAGGEGTEGEAAEGSGG